jgi:hypothetical protein
VEAVQGSMVKHCMRVQYADALWSTGVPLVVDCSETTAICHPCQNSNVVVAYDNHTSRLLTTSLFPQVYLHTVKISNATSWSAVALPTC